MKAWRLNGLGGEQADARAIREALGGSGAQLAFDMVGRAKAPMRHWRRSTAWVAAAASSSWAA
jgi:hypothetical protein